VELIDADIYIFPFHWTALLIKKRISHRVGKFVKEIKKDLISI
jgi:hypothetical protein